MAVSSVSAKSSRWVVMTLVSFVASIVLSVFGATVDVVQHELFHVLEHRVDNALINKTCASAASEFAVVAKLCNPSASTRTRLKSWAQEKLSNAWKSVKEKFGVGGTEPTTVDNNSASEGEVSAVAELDASLANRAPPDAVAADYIAEGDLSPPTEAEKNANETQLIEGEPGGEVGTLAAEPPVDALVGSGEAAPGAVLAEALSGGGNISSGTAAQATTLASKVGRVAFKAVFNKLSLAFVGASVVLAWGQSQLSKDAQEAQGPNYWSPTDGDMTQWAIGSCNSGAYTTYMANQPGAPVASVFFWGYDPNAKVYTGTYQGSTPSASIQLAVPDVFIGGTNYSSGTEALYKDFADNATQNAGQLFKCPAINNTLRIPGISPSRAVPAGLHTAATDAAVKTWWDQVNSQFTIAKEQSFASIAANPAAINLAQTYFIMGAPVPGNQSLQGLYSITNPSNLAQNLPTLPAYAQVAAQLCAGQGSSCPAVSTSLQDYTARATKLENQIKCGADDCTGKADVATSATDTATKNQEIGLIEQSMGHLEAAFPDGTDLLAGVLTTKNAQGQVVARTNGVAYQQMIDQLTGDAACGKQSAVLAGWGCSTDGNGHVQPSTGAYLTYQTIAKKSRHAATRDAINTALATALNTCGCSSLLPKPLMGNTATLASSPLASGDIPSDTYMAMMLALTDVVGNYGITYDGTGTELQSGSISQEGNQGIAGLLPSQYASGLAMVPKDQVSNLGGGTGTTDLGVSDQYTASSMVLMTDLRAHTGDVMGAFQDYVLQNNLPPVNGRWASDPPAAIDAGWGSVVTAQDGQTGAVSTATLLTNAYDQYLAYFAAPDNQVSGPSNQPTVDGYALPPTNDVTSIDAAAKANNIDAGVLYAMANSNSGFENVPSSTTTGTTPQPQLDATWVQCSSDTELVPKQIPTGNGKPIPPGQGSSVPNSLVGKTIPVRFGIMGMTPQEFAVGVAAAQANGHSFPADTLTPLPMQNSCPDFGEPTGMLTPDTEIWAAAAFLAHERDTWATYMNNGNSAGDPARLTSSPIGYTQKTFADTYGTANDTDGSAFAYAMVVYYLWNDYTADGQLAVDPSVEGPGPKNSGNPQSGEILSKGVEFFPNGTNFITAVWPPDTGSSGFLGIIAPIAGLVALGFICPPCALVVGTTVAAIGAVQTVGAALALNNTDLSANTQKLESTLSQNLMDTIGKVQTLTTMVAPVYDLWETGWKDPQNQACSHGLQGKGIAGYAGSTPFCTPGVGAADLTGPVGGVSSKGNVFFQLTISDPQSPPVLFAGVGGPGGDGTLGLWGQCTWFSSLNFYKPLGGDGGHIWSKNGGVPNTNQPLPIGAAVSWAGPGYGAATGHTGIVVYMDPGAKYYIVAEANYHTPEVNYPPSAGNLGYIDLRKISFPDSELLGYVPPAALETSPNDGSALAVRLQQVIANNGNTSITGPTTGPLVA